MIAKKFRLTTSEIKEFFNKKYSKLIENGLKIYYQANNFSYPKFSVICKKEIFKKAVERNEIKRRIYSVINIFLKRVKIKNYNIIIIPCEMKEFKTVKDKLEISLFKLTA
ncbi:MAG: ribonuclease P protein component [Patescibacteria group bacterium]|nr:ribonuclease P protein component [Patescibacteria group bacterium]